ncbi:MAG: SDR family oxidoreductase [Acidimicrobiales bacterium]|jgi:NAD(P)-dependent dehydrogenase (short-subunit alcohol dehydrogenase family)|nr:SDR family oxidoreductase [Acidimicrobiales bacterium]
MGNACAGRVALVTGASRGIGKAIALRLAAEGAAVAICSRPRAGMADLGTLDGAADDLRSVGAAVLAVPFDLADPAVDRGTLVDRVEAELGPVDILVNNAAGGGFRSLMDWSDAAVEHVLQLNFWAPWHLVRRVVPGMRERGSGWVLNLSSATAIPPQGPPFPDTAPATMGTIYGGTKAFLDRWTASLAAEVAPDGVVANTLAPQAAAATELLVAHSDLPAHLYEPLETMAEAALALCTADPTVLTGRIASSLELLVELDRATLDLRGREELPEWAPALLGGRIERMAAHAAGRADGAVPSNVAALLDRRPR